MKPGSKLAANEILRARVRAVPRPVHLEIRQSGHPRSKIDPPAIAVRVLDVSPGRHIGPTGFFCRWPAPARILALRKTIPLAGAKMALAAAVAVARLAVSFRDAKPWTHDLDRRDALAIFRLRRVLFSRRFLFGSGTRADGLFADWHSGRVHVLPRPRGGPAAC